MLGATSPGIADGREGEILSQYSPKELEVTYDLIMERPLGSLCFGGIGM